MAKLYHQTEMFHDALQALKAIDTRLKKMIGFSNIVQYHKFRNMLITANRAMESAHAQRKSSGSNTE